MGAARFEQACALLAPETRKAVAEASPCGPALAGKRLPATAGAAVTQTFGRQAMVRLTGDTLFLSQFDAGWKVVAAGCTPRAEQPYDCLVKGA
ncbi:hypothetical protein HYE82_13760 [Streptomyces sp. BR123]|nr:hypothetical protein [Streptomyces sp. BR123]